MSTSEENREYIESNGFSIGETVLIDGLYRALICDAPLYFDHVHVELARDEYLRFAKDVPDPFPYSHVHFYVSLDHLSKLPEAE